MQIGMIGGIGPAATDYYYRRLVSAYAKQGMDLELTMVHADAPTLLSNLSENRVSKQVSIYRKLTDRLVSAGAGCVVVTSIAGHFCIQEFIKHSPLPVINMIETTRAEIAARNLKSVGILGTKIVMESRFYGAIDTAVILPPSGQLLNDVHEAYATMAKAGFVTPEQQAVFNTASQQLLEQGAQAIMLGGTDLALVYSQETSEFPILDCAAIHCDAVMAYARSV